MSERRVICFIWNQLRSSQSGIFCLLLFQILKDFSIYFWVHSILYYKQMPVIKVFYKSLHFFYELAEGSSVKLIALRLVYFLSIIYFYQFIFFNRSGKAPSLCYFTSQTFKIQYLAFRLDQILLSYNLIINMKPVEGYQKQKPKKVKWINPLRNRIRVVPFVVPNQEERMVGLGSLVGEKWRTKKSLQAIIKQFDPIKEPKPGDCLYQYQEDGQTFPLFASMYRNHIDPKEEIIYIATFYSKLSQENIKKFKKNTKLFFCDIKVKTHHFQKTDLNKFNPIKSQQGDTYYDAALMNVYFSKNLPKKCYSIAILTDLLIYNGDNPVELLSDKWVFGLGSIKDRTSVMSYTEMIKKGYEYKYVQDQVKQRYQDQFNLQMMEKVINHQLCHTFGMKHCIFYTCLMNGSNGYHEASVKPSHLCPVCLRKLQYSIGFDFVQRYEKLSQNGDEKSGVLKDLIRCALGQGK